MQAQETTHVITAITSEYYKIVKKKMFRKISKGKLNGRKLKAVKEFTVNM